MSDVQWTRQQEQAIHETDRGVLLTASAGSGKTAVLVQRCLHLLTDGPSPCQVDELLVLTFTEAAATQMRRRIGQALRGRLEQQPDDLRLQRQLALLDQADITTVHAFCAKLLREYYYLLSIDPTFEVLDGDEAELLKGQVAGELFETYYAGPPDDAPDDFSQFVDAYGSASGDRPLTDLIIKLHDFLSSLESHEKMIRNWRDTLATIGPTNTGDLHIVARQNQKLQTRLHSVINCLEHSLQTITHYPQAQMYAGYVQDDMLPPMKETLKALAGKDFNLALHRLGELKFKSAPRRNKDIPPEQTEPVKNLIDQAKESLKGLQARYGANAARVRRELEATAPNVHLLCKLQEEFRAGYERIKRRQNVLDFDDLERLCLQLLQPGADGPASSDVAAQLQQACKYILVDEYQDISPIQEAIIQSLCEPKSGDNLFIVGDVKQSIYGFRLPDPEIFQRKLEQDQGRRIDLNKNFRTRRELIAVVNAIFCRCMTHDFAKIDYKRDAQLSFGAEYYDQAEANATGPTSAAMELHLLEETIDVNDVPDIDATRRQAMIIGRRIQEMVGDTDGQGQAQFDVLDPDTHRPRPVTYRDIVVLLRSMKGVAECWNDVFAQMQIPVHAQLSRGYFAATEIQDMLSLLQLIDNPRQDICLATVLRSPFVGLSETALGAIRLAGGKAIYHEAVIAYAAQEPKDPLAVRLAQFLDQLTAWRKQSRHGILSDLIWQIYRQTDLLAYVCGLPHGRQRCQNLLHLHDRACQFDGFAQQGLTRFLSFLQKLREDEGDFRPAPVLTEADNVVRIMSIHQSKGLEFPVVIVAHLERKFNKRDCSHSILFQHGDAGAIGLNVVDPDSHDRWPTLANRLIADDIEERLLAEEMRLLYVAMTRARERLLLCAAGDLDKTRQRWQPWRFDGDQALPEFILSSAAAPIDWIGMALAPHADLRAFLLEDGDEAAEDAPDDIGDTRFNLTVYDQEKVCRLIEATSEESDAPETAENLDEVLATPLEEDHAGSITEVIDRVDWHYPHDPLAALSARTSATDLKHRFETDRDADLSPDQVFPPTASSFSSAPTDVFPRADLVNAFSQTPRFLSEQPGAPDGADVGSWMHLFLQRLDLDPPLDPSGLEHQLKEMVQKGLVNEQQSPYIHLESVARFFESALGKEMLSHRETLHREWPFTLAVPAAQVYGDRDLSPTDQRESVLVRGIIDCLFETRQGWVIVDYKADAVSLDECPERAERYRVPMMLYRQAAQAILQQSVDRLCLYFLHAGRTVTLL